MQVVVAVGVGCVSIPGKHFWFVRFRRVPVTLAMRTDFLPAFLRPSTCPLRHVPVALYILLTTITTLPIIKATITWA